MEKMEKAKFVMRNEAYNPYNPSQTVSGWARAHWRTVSDKDGVTKVWVAPYAWKPPEEQETRKDKHE